MSLEAIGDIPASILPPLAEISTRILLCVN
jgi:hypothetical protein